MKYSSIIAKSKGSGKLVAKWKICDDERQERVRSVSWSVWLGLRATCEGGQVVEGWTGFSLSEVGGTRQALLIRPCLVIFP